MDNLGLFQRSLQDIFLSRNAYCRCRSPLILAVDDDEDNLLLLSYTLEMLNCSALTAPDGYTALSLLETNQPDLILLDIVMPHLDGIQLVHHLRQESKTATIPVIAVTAMAGEEDRERFLGSGFNDYISKPFILEDLENLIRHYLHWTPSLLAAPNLKMDYVT